MAVSRLRRRAFIHFGMASYSSLILSYLSQFPLVDDKIEWKITDKIVYIPK